MNPIDAFARQVPDLDLWQRRDWRRRMTCSPKENDDNHDTKRCLCRPLLMDNLPPATKRRSKRLHTTKIPGFRRAGLFLTFWSARLLLAAFPQCSTVLVVSAERAYPLGCSHRDPSFYDYENTKEDLESFLRNRQRQHRCLAVKSHDDFFLLRRLGTGKFSDVFEAVEAPQTDESNDNDNNVVVLKCLKPVSERKIKREVLVLLHASKLPNLARIVGVVLPERNTNNDNGISDLSKKAIQVPRMPTLVLEHAGRESQWLCHNAHPQGRGKALSNTPEWLTPHEIRFFLYHLLVALDSLHAVGIMHRDVKPRNVLIRRGKREGRNNNNNRINSNHHHDQPSLMLLDLGLADFYHPEQQRYNVRVASRHYKSPELLIGFEQYDYAVDLWGVGCMLAGLLFRREPLFRGRDNLDQLAKICARLGTSDLVASCVQRGHWPRVSPDVLDVLSQCHAQGAVHRRSWDDLWPAAVDLEGEDGKVNDDDEEDMKQFRWQGIDLLDKLLVYDHEQRWTARQAMQHCFFDSVRDQVHEQLRQQQEQQQQNQSAA